MGSLIVLGRQLLRADVVEHIGLGASGVAVSSRMNAG